MNILSNCFCSYFVLNVVIVFGNFNVQAHEQVHNLSEIFYPASHLQELAHSHHEVNTTNNKTDRTIQQHRSQLRKNRTQAQQHRQNTTRAQPLINNRAIHPKIRPLLELDTNTETQLALIEQPKPIFNSNSLSIPMNQNEPHPFIETTSKSSTHKHTPLANNFFQQQFQAFFRHQHNNQPSRTRSNIKTGLR